MKRPSAFFFFAGHPHQRQGIAIALHEAIQLQTKRFGIQSVGLYPPVVLIQFLRTDHVALNRERAQLALQRKTKSTRFIDRVHFGATFSA